MGDSGKIRKVSAFMQFCCLGVAALFVVFQLFFLIVINVEPAMIMPVLTEREAVVAIAEAGTLNAVLASVF